jgi:hypothetical protein
MTQSIVAKSNDNRSIASDDKESLIVTRRSLGSSPECNKNPQQTNRKKIIIETKM